MKKITEGLKKAIETEYRRILREYGEGDTHRFNITYRKINYYIFHLYGNGPYRVYQVNPDNLHLIFIDDITLNA